MIQDTASNPPFLAQYEDAKSRLPGGTLPWMSALREQAMTAYAAKGLPTVRRESWKYTNLRPLLKLELDTAGEPAASLSIDRAPSLLADTVAYRAVFVNGLFRAELSDLAGLPDGAVIGSLAQIAEDDPDRLKQVLGSHGEYEAQPLLALNTALMRDGLILQLEAGQRLDRPLEIVHVNAAETRSFAHQARNLFLLGENCEATVIEQHVGLDNGAYYINSATDIDLAAGARLRHYRIQAEGEQAIHTTTLNGRVAGDGHYDSFTLSVGAALSRNEVAMKLIAEGASCHLNGAYLMRGQQHCDTTTTIDHLVPHTSCREVFKGVLDERARGVFQGRIVVHPDAQQTDGHQLNKVLLLSDKAEIDAKPELEIYADDVKCSHGCSAGEVDHDALFYLRSRGLPEPMAKAMLIKAFLAEAVTEMEAEDLHQIFVDKIADWLATESWMS